MENIPFNHLSLANIMSPEENNTLTVDINLTDSVFDNLKLSDRSDSIQLETLLNNIQETKRSAYHREISIYGGTGTLILIISAIIICCVCYNRVHKQKGQNLTVMLNSVAPKNQGWINNVFSLSAPPFITFLYLIRNRTPSRFST